MILSDADFQALWITAKLASLTTLLLLLLGTPLAWWLARSRWRFKFLIEAVIALPLVLPPVVLGFYLLLVLGNQGAIGQLSKTLGGQPLAFSFTGLVIGSIIYSLPFVVQPLQVAFTHISQRSLEVAATLGAGKRERFMRIIFPQVRAGFLTASVLGFAHTVGEFGVVLMIGGNIPNETQVISIAIYEHVEALEYTQAHWLSAGLVCFSLVMLMTIYALNHRFHVVKV